jgi:hypothetical protein
MNSKDYYRILYGWDVEFYLTSGIRYCAIFIKLTESLSDNLLVKYVNGTHRRVAGMYLFTDQSLALAYVEEQKQKEIAALNSKIQELKDQKEAVYKKYLDAPPIEEAMAIAT